MKQQSVQVLRCKIINMVVLGALVLLAISLSGCYKAQTMVGNTFGISSLTGSAKADHLPGVFNEPSKSRVVPGVTAEKIKSDMAKYYKIYKFVIYGDDEGWDIRRNNLGLIEDRISRREVWIAYKDLKDGKYYHNAFKYLSQYDGSSYSDPRPRFSVPTEISEELATK